MHHFENPFKDSRHVNRDCAQIIFSAHFSNTRLKDTKLSSSGKTTKKLQVNLGKKELQVNLAKGTTNNTYLESNA